MSNPKMSLVALAKAAMCAVSAFVLMVLVNPMTAFAAAPTGVRTTEEAVNTATRAPQGLSWLGGTILFLLIVLAVSIVVSLILNYKKRRDADRGNRHNRNRRDRDEIDVDDSPGFRYDTETRTFHEVEEHRYQPRRQRNGDIVLRRDRPADNYDDRDDDGTTRNSGSKKTVTTTYHD